MIDLFCELATTVLCTIDQAYSESAQHYTLETSWTSPFQHPMQTLAATLPVYDLRDLRTWDFTLPIMSPMRAQCAIAL